MKQVNRLAQSYVDLLLKLGLIRSSLLVALIFVVLIVALNIGINFVISGQLSVISSVLFGIILTCLAIYFFSCVVSLLAESRQRYCDVIMSLEEAHASDVKLNAQLKKTIAQLNQEIDERERIEKVLHDSMRILEEKSTKLEKARLELAEQTTLLSSFLNASPDLIYYRNEKGQFSGCNKAIEALTGKSQAQLIGLTPWDVYPINDASEIVKTDQLVFDSEEPITYEHWLTYPDGRKACFEMHKVPFYSDQGYLLGLLGFGREISLHKSYQEALEKASRDKTTFISTISHELRTPLNAIVGFSRRLLDGNLQKEQYDQLRTIYVSAVTLGQIFNGIIDLDKADRGRLELFPEKTNLSDFISGIEYIGKLMAEQDGLAFSFDVLSSPLPKSVLMDATRLRQILWNLLSNAFKFTNNGAVNVGLFCEVVNNQAMLTFEVEDSGVGICEAEQENIFAMYYQVKQNENNLHATGTGIGLAISRENAQLMGGDIKVESELGFGSTFTLTLSAPIYQTQQAVKKQEHNDRYHILLVEDIELNVTVATNYLEKLGHSVAVARTGYEALALFAKDKFDCLLLDIQLPDITGFEIVKKLREQYDKLPPFIALTANVIKDKNEYLNQGMSDALSKPFTLEDLAKVINNALNYNDTHSHHDLPKNDKKDLDAGEPTDDLSETLLDLTMLESYVELVGVEAMIKSVKMFEQLILEYLATLELNLMAKDQAGIVCQAHKIKGAASAVGLKHIQEIANKAQSPALPAWWDNINDWIDEIKLGYQHDLMVLNNWLKTYSTPVS